MNKTDYLTLMDKLNQAVMEDPTALLALTVAWLDPLAILDDLEELAETDLSDFYYSGDEAGAALRVTRDCFPGIYTEAIGRLRDGTGYPETVAFISAAITAQTGIPMDSYGEPVAYAFGIPLPFYGAEWEQTEFIEAHPELTDLALLLGASREQTRWGETMEFADRVYRVAHILQHSLEAYPDDPLLRSLMWAIAHCTASSGNSSIDLSYDEGIEFQPLAWEPDAVDFASAIIQEAEQILTESQVALQRMQTDRQFRQTLVDKIYEANRIVEQLEKRGKNPHDAITDDHPNPFGLRWDDVCAGADGNAASDAERLQLRLDAA